MTRSGEDGCDRDEPQREQYAGAVRTEARFPGIEVGAGHYESFYLKAAAPGGGQALWLRHTIHKRPGAEPTASIWLTVFDAARSPRATKLTVGSDQLSTPDGAYVRIAGCEIGPGRAAGSVAGAGLEAKWDLSFEDRHEAFRHLPSGWMYNAKLPRTKLLSPHPGASWSGTIEIDGETIALDGWPGMVGHNWGAEHAERWIWLHAADFEGGSPGDYIDIGAGRIKIGRWTTPWIANGMLVLDGTEHRLGGLGKTYGTEVDAKPGSCGLIVAGKGVTVKGSFSAPLDQFVGWVYSDPDGGEHNTINCSIADMELKIERPSRKHAHIRVCGGAAYELGMRETDHGVDDAAVRRRLRPALTGALAALVLVVFAGAVPTQAGAARGLDLGFADPILGVADPGVRELWQSRAASAGANTIRISLPWNAVAAREPTAPRDPADPAYDFRSADAAIADAARQRFRILLTLSGAPSWAEGPGRPASAAAGSWKPSPLAFEAFVDAVATRYSGSFSGLPAVRWIQAWNEPNLELHLAPQWQGKQPVAPHHYKLLLNAARRGIDAAPGKAKLMTAGLAPYGDRPGKDRTRPLFFWRDVFCLKNRVKLKRKRPCRNRAAFDVFAHNAINGTGSPTISAFHPDDVSTADLGALVRTLRAAEKRRTIRGPKRHRFWVTETWWASNPPDPDNGLPPPLQARYIQDTLYLAWKARADGVIQLLIRDAEPPSNEVATFNASGLYDFDGRPKVSLRAFEFPFVASSPKRGTRVWGIAPARGKVVVEARRGGRKWRPVERFRVGRNGVFAGSLQGFRGRATLRARSGDGTSLSDKVR